VVCVPRTYTLASWRCCCCCLLFGVKEQVSSRMEMMGEGTWLILPVVICLSQRLSHACVSINSFVL
jgi:hypothetical protein